MIFSNLTTNRSTKDVLSEKRGMAMELGLTMIVMTLMVAASTMLAGYAALSTQASQLKTLNQEISNRAELYAGALNADLATTQVPSMARECTTMPAMCTTILAVTPAAGGTSTVLRIQGDTVSGLGQTITKDVTLVSADVTHVTALDEVGNPTWAVSDEGLRYKVWGVATGKPSTIKPEDIAGPTQGTYWVSVADRAGIDSTGALWVWGKNDIGQAGIGSASTAAAKPTKFEAPGVQFRSVLTVDDRGYAIDSKGGAWLWGKNDKNQLGLPGAVVMKPTTFPGFRVMSMIGGKDNTFGLLSTGQLMWVGAPQTGLPPAAGGIINEGTKYRAIAASTTGAFAMIDSSGKLSVVGSSYPFTPHSGNFTHVSLGPTTGYAIGGSGNLYSWGVGADGQLGLGATASVATPTQVMAGTRFVAVEATKTGAFAIDTAGNLYYFGKSPSGFVGGVDLPKVNVPTKLLPESRFRDIAASSADTSVALLDSMGNLYGLGTTTPGLWPMNYLGANDQLIRMPLPDGFSSDTWK